jgi:hypothetical protein
MTWWTWGTLVFLIVAVLGSIGYAATRAWRLWRTVRALGGAVSDAVARLTAAAEAAERKAASLNEHASRLEATTTRLQHALAELAVLRAAAGEARGAFAAVRGVVPRK